MQSTSSQSLLNIMLLRVSTLLLLPALLIQGYRVKKNTPRLAEPMGERCGMSGQGNRPLSLLILGDSAAAGVGVEHQSDALLGQLLKILSPDYQVHFCLEATTGHNSQQIINALDNVAKQNFDVVISSVGVNDVTTLKQPDQWLKLQQRLYQAVEEKFHPQLLIISGVPPMNEFPALPFPLSWLFGQYSQQMNALLKIYVNTQANMRLIEYDLHEYREKNLQMAQDGFHPSKEIYQLWAEKIAKQITEQFS